MLNSLTLPIIIGAVTAYYLYEIIKLNSGFNYNFVVPVAVIILIFCTVELVNVLRRREGDFMAAVNLRNIGQTILHAPEIRFGAMVVAFLVLFEYIPFVVLSVGFLVLSPLVVARDSTAPLVTMKWAVMSLIIASSTYAIFKMLLDAPLY